jgi:hypothetical protein
MEIGTVSEMFSEHQMKNRGLKAQYSYLYRIYVILTASVVWWLEFLAAD